MPPITIEAATPDQAEAFLAVIVAAFEQYREKLDPPSGVFRETKGTGSVTPGPSSRDRRQPVEARTMHIEHVAIWTHNLDRLVAFYTAYLGGEAGPRYHNPRTGFESVFVRFEAGARLEIMQMPGIPANANDPDAQATGLIHLAFSVGSREAVDALTERLAMDGLRVIGAPRTTGDGYYESLVLDPDGNRVEITV